MRKFIERYKYESDLQLEKRINLMLMCDLGQELISQRRFNNDTAAIVYIMNCDDFENVNIDKLFNVLVSESSGDKTVTLNISIDLNRWKALYEAWITVNEWIINMDKKHLVNLSDQSELVIPDDCDLLLFDDDAYNQNIINERLVRYIVASDILARKSANKTC